MHHCIKHHYFIELSTRLQYRYFLHGGSFHQKNHRAIGCIVNEALMVKIKCPHSTISVAMLIRPAMVAVTMTAVLLRKRDSPKVSMGRTMTFAGSSAPRHLRTDRPLLFACSWHLIPYGGAGVHPKEKRVHPEPDTWFRTHCRKHVE